MNYFEIKDISETDLKKLKKLYLTSFKDPKPFVELFFASYAKNTLFWYEKDEKDNIKIMSTLVKKRAFINGEKLEVGFIVAIAVDKKYQGQGVMKNFVNQWLKQIKDLYPYIFIQAYNWNIYKSFDFIEFHQSSEWYLRKDQFLFKDVQIYEDIKFEQMNQTYIDFVKQNNFENYVYKTSKEFKAYYKMILACNEQIIQSKNAWIVYDGNQVYDYAFTDLKEFIKLLSTIEFKTKIISEIDLDKRYFYKFSEDKVIRTKVLKNKNTKDLKLYFNDCF